MTEVAITDTRPPGPERRVHRFDRRAMGSPLRLTVVDGIEATGDRHADAAMESRAAAAWLVVSDEVEACEQAMSRFRESSDLTRLNRTVGTGRPVEVDRRLIAALVAADRAGRISGGRFDARVLADLERLGYRGAAVQDHPTDGASSGPTGVRDGHDRRRWLAADPRASTASLVRPIDLGGIGKGLALRRAWRLVERTGLVGRGGGALLEAGGDLVAGGSSPDGRPWVVGIEDPSGGRPALAAIVVAAGAVATSSVRVHRWLDDAGRPVHHLVDPSTGRPGGAGLESVTVAGRDPAWAEVWSKVLFLEGVHGIARLARSRGLAAWWMTEEGRVEMTAAARPRTIWVATET